MKFPLICDDDGNIRIRYNPISQELCLYCGNCGDSHLLPDCSEEQFNKIISTQRLGFDCKGCSFKNVINFIPFDPEIEWAINELEKGLEEMIK
jgi:hypothetical protein